MKNRKFMKSSYSKNNIKNFTEYMWESKKGLFLRFFPSQIFTFIRKILHFNGVKIVLTSLIAAFTCTGIIYAATTVGTNINTTGTLSVTGASTLTGNTTVAGTISVTGNSIFTTASSTGIVKFSQINSDTGAISFGDENLSTTGTLTVTGLTTMGNASTTLLSISNTGYIGGPNGLILADGSITDASGAISFEDENLTTTGNLIVGYATTTGNLEVQGDITIKEGGTMVMTPPAFTANSGTAPATACASVDSITHPPGAGQGAWGATGEGTKYYMTDGKIFRPRKSGDIEQVKFYVNSGADGTDNFYLQIWRKDGSTWDLVAESEDLCGVDCIGDNWTAGAANTVTLVTPIAIQRGDYVGYKEVRGADATTATFRYVSTSITNVITYSHASAPSSTDFDWTGADSSDANNALQIDLIMDKPKIVFAGDSLMTGATVTSSFCNGNNIEVTGTDKIAYHWSLLSGETDYFVSAVSGDKTADFYSDTWQEEVIDPDPEWIIMMIGTNNVTDTTPITGAYASYISDMTTFMDEAEAAGIKMVIMSIPPATTFNKGQCIKRLAFNHGLESLTATYDNFIFVDTSVYIGQDASGVYPGNLCDIQTTPVDYDDDGTHLTSAGYAQLAQAIWDAQKAFTLKNSAGTAPALVVNEGVKHVSIGQYQGVSGGGLSVKGTIKADKARIDGEIFTNMPDLSATPIVPMQTTGFWTYSYTLDDDTSGTCGGEAANEDCLILPDPDYNAMVFITTHLSTWGMFVLNASGGVTMLADSGSDTLASSIFSTTASDCTGGGGGSNICLYDGGDNATLHNNSGASQIINIFMFHN
jgi:lysophospholipase L1-like esterase